MATIEDPSGLRSIGLAAPAQGFGRFGSIAPTVTVLFVGCALSYAVYVGTSRAHQESEKLKFEQEAGTTADQIERKIDGTIAVLRSVVSFYAASRSVERSEFRAFTSGLASRASVQALSWVPQVTPVQRQRYEEAARQDGFSDFAFTERNARGELVPAGDRIAHFPVFFIEPYDGNKAAHGFDLASNPARLEALNKARDTGEMVATSRITLVQETGDQYGLLVFVPIYRNGMPHSTVAERRAALIGLSNGVFRIGDLVEAAFAGSSSSQAVLKVRLYDLSAPEDARLLYPKVTQPDHEAVDRAGPFYERALSVAGRRWLVEVTPTAAYHQRTNSLWRPWAVLPVGLVLTLLAALYLRSVTGRARVIEHLVAERTAELIRVNEQLVAQVAVRTRAEISLARRAEELARSNAELEQFASIASHDLQEPLRKVQAFGDRLQRKYAEALDEQGADYLSRMGAATSRMQTLIDDLLSYSRVSTKGKPFVPVDLSRLVEEVISDLEVLIQETGAEVRIGGLPIIDADPTQMRQLFQNLIGNALKYRRDGVSPVVEVEGRIEVPNQSRPDLPPKQVCHLRVSDNGIGFEQEYAERIFGIFQRLHGRDVYEGTGVGLAICRKIAERHGGSIRAEGRPGQGATMIAMFPVTTSSTEDAESIPDGTTPAIVTGATDENVRPQLANP